MRRSDLSLWLTVPLWVWWGVWEGGYPVTVWAPGLVYLAAVCLLLLRSVPRAPLAGPRLWALAAAAGLVALCALSILWAADQGRAWTTTSRLALYVAALALPLLWPPSLRALRAGVLAFAAVAVLGLGAGVVAAFGDAAALSDGRLADPTGYPNATAALLLMAAFALLPLAVERGRRVGPRALLLGTAGVLAGASLLCQSRGAVGTSAIMLAALVLIGPRRGAVAIASLCMVAVLVPVAPVLFDVRTAALEGDADGRLAVALGALAAVGVALALGGRVALRSDERGRLSRLPAWRPGRPALGAVVVAAVGLFALANATGWLAERAHDVSTPRYDELEAAGTRFTGNLGSNRVDYWRVSLELLGERPVHGVGAGGFAEAYLARRDSDISPLYAHSGWLQTASGLGGLGLLLLAVAAAALLLALRASFRAAPDAARATLAAAMLPLAYLGVHGSADWVVQFPGVVVPALVLAAAAARPAERSAGGGGRAGVATLALVALVAVAVIPHFLASSYHRRAGEQAPVAPLAALRDLDRAQTLDPLSPGPAVQEGLVALQVGDRARAARAFREALERNDRAWFSHLMLALVLAREGDERAAGVHLGEAARLNPREPSIQRSRAKLGRGEAVDPLRTAARVLRDGG